MNLNPVLRLCLKHEFYNENRKENVREYKNSLLGLKVNKILRLENRKRVKVQKVIKKNP